MIAKYKLTGEAKLWGKEWCREQTIDKTTTTWKLFKEAFKERYLPLDHETLKMNEFYGLTQKHLSVDAYYSKFVKLKRYAPPMTKPQAVSHFVQGLNPPLNHRLESMRPESLQDAVLRAKPLEEEIRSSSHIRKQPPYSKPFLGIPKGPIITQQTLEYLSTKILIHLCKIWLGRIDYATIASNQGIVELNAPILHD